MPWFSEESGKMWKWKVGKCEKQPSWKESEFRISLTRSLSLSLSIKNSKVFRIQIVLRTEAGWEVYGEGGGKVYQPQNNYISSGTRPYIKTLHKKSLTIKKFGEFWHNQWRSRAWETLSLPVRGGPWDLGATLTRWQAREMIRYNSIL